MDEMLTVEMVAKRFNVSQRTVVRLIKSREIRALRVGRQWRFKKEWIEEWIAQNTSHPAEEDTA